MQFKTEWGTSWHGEFNQVVYGGLHDSTPYYFVQQRLSALVDPECQQADLAGLFGQIVEVVGSIEVDALPNQHNRSVVGLGALSVLALLLEPETASELGPSLSSNTENIGDILSTLPLRVINDGGSVDVAAGLSSASPVAATEKAVKGDLDPNLLAQYITGVIKQNPDNAEDVQKVYDWHLQDVRTKRDIEQAKAERQARLADDHEQRQQEEKQLRELESEISKAIAANPNDTFAWLLDNVPDGLDDMQMNAALLAPSTAYLAAMVREGTIEDEGWSHARQARGVYVSSIEQRLAEADVDQISLHSPPLASSDVLGAVFPDQDTLQAFVETHLDVLKDPRFFDSWHQSISAMRLAERRNRLPLDQCRELLNEHHLELIQVNVERLGVHYDDLDALLGDVYEYFVANRADTISAADLHSSARALDDSSGITTGILSRFSRPNAQIYTDDIEEPLRQFVESLSSDPEPGKEYIFESIEATGSTPYKHEITSFSDHAIIVRVQINHEGQNVFYLDILGGGYSPDSSGYNIDKFAAFFDKDISYPAQPDIRVSHRPQLPDGLDYTYDGYVEVVDIDVFNAMKGQPLEQRESLPVTYGDGRQDPPETLYRFASSLDRAPLQDVKDAVEEMLGSEVTIENYDLDSHQMVPTRLSGKDLRLVEATNTETGEVTRRSVYLDYARGTRQLRTSELSAEQIENLRAFNNASR